MNIWLAIVSLLMFFLLMANSATAKEEGVHYVPASMSIDNKLDDSVVDLKFNEFFKMPIGAKGLEITPKLNSLVGKKVRIVGYMVRQEPPVAGLFAISPYPVESGDDDEKLVDDYPPNVVFIHTTDAQLAVPYIHGLIKLEGVLSVGNQEEADGHMSAFRLQLDTRIEQDLKQALAKANVAENSSK